MKRSWLATLLLAACGSSGGGSSGPTVLFDPPASGTQFAMHSVPWPNDVFLGANGHPDMVLEYTTPPADAHAKANIEASLKEQDGWGVTTGAFFWTSEEVDETTVTADNAYIVDLATGAKLGTQVHVRLDPFSIVVNQAYGVVFLENAKYAFVLGTGIKTKTGKPVVMADNLSKVLSATAAPPDPALAKAFAAYAPFKAWMTAQNKKPSDFAGVTVLTTKTIRKDLTTIHTRIAAAPAKMTVKQVLATKAELDDLFGPAITDNRPGYGRSADGIAHDQIAVQIQGTFKSPNYMADAPGKNGIFTYDASGPIEKSKDDVPFVLYLPKAPANADYSNLPVVIWQHGLNGSREDVIGVANELARAGYATIGMDLPFHGDRFLGSVDQHHNQRANVPTPDGFPDSGGLSASLKFTDIVGDGDVQFDPRAIRASFLQSAIDHMSLTHMLMAGDLGELKTMASVPSLSFKIDRIVYAGISFGSITGGITIAAEPHLGAAFLSVGGGGILFPNLVNSPVYGPYFLTFINGAGSLSAGEVDYRLDPPQFHTLYQMFQMTIDGGDPLAWAPYVIRKPMPNPGKHLVLQNALLDESVPNQGSEDLAVAQGLPLFVMGNTPTPPTRFATFPGMVDASAGPVKANVMAGDGTMVTAGWEEYKDASHGGIVSVEGEHQYDPAFPPFNKLATPISFANPVIEIQKQLVAFVKGYVDTGVPALIDPYQ